MIYFFGEVFSSTGGDCAIKSSLPFSSSGDNVSPKVFSALSCTRRALSSISSLMPIPSFRKEINAFWGNHYKMTCDI